MTMCHRRYLLASLLLLLEALFNHCLGLNAYSDVPVKFPTTDSMAPCASCAPEPSSSAAPSHSDEPIRLHLERQLLRRLGLSRRPPQPLPGAVAAISDHMHDLYQRFAEDSEWEDFIWIVGDRRKELGRLSAVRAHRLVDSSPAAHPNATTLQFDLSSLANANPNWSEDEAIAGELRLHLNLTGPAGHAHLDVFEVLPRPPRPPLVHLLHSRKLPVPSADWRHFDVSPALVRWARRPRWRRTGEGKLMLRLSAPSPDLPARRRHRRSVDSAPTASSPPADVGWQHRDSQLFSYYRNAKSRERRRQRKRHRRKNRNRNRKRKRTGGGRKRNRNRRRRRKKQQQRHRLWLGGGSGRHEKRNVMLSPDTRRACQRRRMYVDFADVGWNGWIVAPPGYHAGLCHGDCTESPLSDSYNTTNHAIIQRLVYARQPTEVPPPCCVAVQLSAKAILLFDENRNVILKNYEGMIVDSCGCR